MKKRQAFKISKIGYGFYGQPTADKANRIILHYWAREDDSLKEKLRKIDGL